MESIRKIVREVLYESVFQESARRMESLPEGTGLFIKNINGGYTMVLYNPKTEDVYASITIVDAVSPKHYYVGGVAVEKGFGPFIYELAMMVANTDGRGVMPTRDDDVRGDAWRVWEMFYERDDIKKETTPFESEDFSFKIFDDHGYLSMEEKEEWLQNIKEDKWMSIKSLMAFNTAFSMEPDNQIRELVSRADDWIKDGFDIDEAIEAGDAFWETKYMEESINEEREVEGIDDKKKLSVFDFDSTLVMTPTPEEGMPEWEEKTGKPWKGGWWANPDSLNTDVFEMPTNPDVITAYKKEISNPDNLVVMITGRIKPLRKHVEHILDMHGLKFHDYLYNSGGETSNDKITKMELALKYNPGIREIAMYDDRSEHIPVFKKWGQKMIDKGYLDKFKIHHVK